MDRKPKKAKGIEDAIELLKAVTDSEVDQRHPLMLADQMRRMQVIVWEALVHLGENPGTIPRTFPLPLAYEELIKRAAV